MKVTIIVNLNKPNKNGRIYTVESMEEAIKRCGGKLNGQIGIAENSFIEPKNVSHQFEKLWIEDGKLMGEMKIVDNVSGMILSEMLKTDSVAFRSAGYGKLNTNDDGTVTVSDYTLMSVNAVNKDTAA